MDHVTLTLSTTASYTTLSPRLVGRAEATSLVVQSLSQRCSPRWLGEPQTYLSVTDHTGVTIATSRL